MTTTRAEPAPAIRASVGSGYSSIYQINTSVWLSEMGQKYGRRIDLSSVLDTEGDAIAPFGFGAVWLIGVWEQCPAGIPISNQKSNLLNDFRRVFKSAHARS